MKHLTSQDFKTMPWKNGGGETVELFKLEAPTHPAGFHFRLSRASVKSDGPFSHFPGIDRILVLLQGKGCHLQFADQNIKFENKLIPFHFEGEEKVFCTLINGEIQDFNVMTDRSWGHSNLEVLQSQGQLVCLEDYLFCYNLVTESLDVLQRGEVLELKNPDHKNLVIRVRKIT